MALSVIKPTIEDYPTSDGKPIAETGFHVTLIAYLLAMLRNYFKDRDDVYVGANMFLYYREDDIAKKIAPDLFVAFGVSNQEQRIWRTWVVPTRTWLSFVCITDNTKLAPN